ncbi:MAG TPA: hypothetical protein PLD20_31220 [Blastocatellia bacterium]|nr:hypothetical protein [Blastocatellia bacterium]HMV82497.1 hypothetical protein [Blastocatellia bacterium]HMZ22443.1 hypothetical protein [Blastocatellia bacterium]
MPQTFLGLLRIAAQATCLLCLCIFLCSKSARAQSPEQSKYSQPTRTFHSPEEFKQITKGKVRIERGRTILFHRLYGSEDGIVRKFGNGIASPYPVNVQLPWNEITVLADDQPGAILIGTKRGLISFNIMTNDVRSYMSGKRWLPDDHVTGIGLEPPVKANIIWVETPKGFSRIEYKEMTLAEKSKAFVERVQKRHVRWGMTSDSILQTPGDLSTNKMVSSDNDGLWTQMYIAAEAFRYAVTKAPDARANAKVGLEAMLRLEQITGISGFHARSIIKIGEDIQPKDGEWHTTADGLWRWKGDTSSDEIVGHYFGYAIYYDLVADEAEKEKIRGVVTRMTDHILNNNYQLIDVDGKRTRWGWWAPEDIWEDPDETGLRALHILAHLRTAHHITGHTRYQQAYEELISKHRYHLLTRNLKINYPGHVNHSDDELAFLSYYPLLVYEKDAKLREVYLQSLERSWQVERPERNPLWNFIFAAGSGAKEFDREESLRTLREIPMDLIEWTVTNSHRLDVPMDLSADRFNRKQSLVVLPYDELPMTKWNGNPYRIDGGNGGRSEDDGAYFLLPYWMGRYHRLIGE